MEVSRIRALRGPNLWSRHTSIEAIVSCTAVECNLSATPRFEPHLRRLFPDMGALPADRPVSMAHALELTTLGLQAQAGCPVTSRWWSNTRKKRWAGWPSIWRGSCVRRPPAWGISTSPARWRNCTSWTRTSASARPPAPSLMPRWRGVSRFAA
jgi:hypothetical protein